MEMILFAGCQGAGKSTFFRLNFFDTHIRINLDMLKTRNREQQLISACLQMKQRFVIDNTNPTKADRRNYIDAAKQAGFKVIGYYFEASIEELLARNAQRSGKSKIPEAGIRGTFNRFEPPAYDEGFDELYHVHVRSDGLFDVVKYVKK